MMVSNFSTECYDGATSVLNAMMVSNFSTECYDGNQLVCFESKCLFLFFSSYITEKQVF